MKYMPLLQAAFSTLVYLVINKVFHRPVKILALIIFFLILLIGSYLIKSSDLVATEHSWNLNHLECIALLAREDENQMMKIMSNELSLNASQRRQYLSKLEHHEKLANQYYKRAHEICWYLPDMSDKETYLFCFTTAANGAAPGTPMSRVVMMTINALCHYGAHCIDA